MTLLPVKRSGAGRWVRGGGSLGSRLEGGPRVAARAQLWHRLTPPALLLDIVCSGVEGLGRRLRVTWSPAQLLGLRWKCWVKAAST